MINKVDADKNGTATKNGDFQNRTLMVSSPSENDTVIQIKNDFPDSRFTSGIASWRRRPSLRTKAIAIAFAIGTLPLLGIETLTYYLFNQSITKEVTNIKQVNAVGLRDQINSFMQARYEELLYIANQSFLVDPQSRANLSPAAKDVKLNNFKDGSNVFESIAVLDLNGQVVSQSKGKPVPNQKQQNYFQTVLKTGKPVISQPLNSKIYLAAPVKDAESDQTINIVVAAMPLKNIEQAIKRSEFSQKDKYHLIDAAGRVMLAHNPKRAGTDIRKEFPDFENIIAQNKVVTQKLVSNLDGDEDMATYVPWKKLEGLPDLKWTVLLTTNTDTSLAPTRQLLLALQMATLATALLIGGVAAMIANRVTQPILAATIAVKKLGKGNLNTRIPVQGEDELATLSSNINQMADQLQDLLRKQTAEAEQLKLFTNILISIRSSLNASDLFNTTVSEARQALRADRVVIYRLNSYGGGEIIGESVAPGVPVAIGETIEDACIDKELIEAYKKGRVQVTNNVSEAGFAPEHMRLMERLQVKAALVTPIIKDDEVFGLLISHHCWGPHVWQPYEINFLRQLGAQVGLTLERVSLLEDTQSLKNLAIDLSGSLNSQEIYNFAVQDIRQALQVERVIIYKFDEEWQGAVIAESVVAGWPCAQGVQLNDPCLKDYVEKYQQGRILAINNIYQANLDHCYTKQLESFSVKANLVAPILLGENLLGLLIAHQCSRPRAWQQSEIDLFEQFARQVGLALERSYLLEQTEEARKAAEIVSQQQRQQKEELQLQLLELLDHIEGASRGDLTVRAEVTTGEIGTVADFFNSIVESLRAIVTQVKEAATQVNMAISENEGAIGQLTTEALKQADEINNTLDAVDQMRLSIKAVAKSARQAAEVARTASHTAETGGIAMDLTVENILSLRETIGETAKKVKRLGESSQQISRVVSLINQIALQTNLLAINAGIEAARAGEGGQGFAVVAEEVAALAARSATATQEIEGVVANIQLETSEVVKAMELGTAQVVEGTRLVEDTKHNLSQILEVCREIDDLVQSISTATVSQVQTSKEVTFLMKQIASVSETTSDSSRKVSESLQKTVEISQELQESVETFKVN